MSLRNILMVGIALSLTACFDDKKGTEGKDAAGPAGTAAAEAQAENNAPAPEMVRRADQGAPFGSPGPRYCPDSKQPTDGAPSKAQVAAYTTCEVEGMYSDMLYLVDKVTVTQIGASRKYAPVTDINMPNIDSRRPIYPIRGNFTRYQCRYLAGKGGSSPEGANCIAYPQPDASGTCYVDANANWVCGMQDLESRVEPTRDVAPPS